MQEQHQQYKSSQSFLSPNSNTKLKIFSSQVKHKKIKRQSLFESQYQFDPSQKYQNDYQFQSNYQRYLSPNKKKNMNIDKQLQLIESPSKEYVKEKQKKLFKLQQLLQKQYFLLSKQQNEKKKLQKQVKDELQKYYTLFIESKRIKYSQKNNQNQNENIIIQDRGFDNCSNFIKQIIIAISKNIQISIIILLNCTISDNANKDKGTICIYDYKLIVDLFINVLYERVSQTNSFIKDITRMISILIAKLPQLINQQVQSILNNKQKQISTNTDKIRYIFNQYMKKQQIQDYFQVLSNSILKKIQRISFRHANNRNPNISLLHSKSIALIQNDNSMQIQGSIGNSICSFGFNNIPDDWLEYIKPFQSFSDKKKALALSFLSYIYSEADLCPNSLKIPLKYYYQAQFQYINKNKKQLKYTQIQIKQICSIKVWKLIQKHYFKRLKPKNNQHMKINLKQNYRQTNKQNKFNSSNINSQNIILRNMSDQNKQTLNDIVMMIQFFFNPNKNNSQNHHKNQQQQIKLQNYKNCVKFIVKVVQKLITVNEQDYYKFKNTINSTSKQNSKKQRQNNELNSSKRIQISQFDISVLKSPFLIKKSDSNTDVSIQKSKYEKVQCNLSPQLIKTYGGCISFKQLQILLYLTKKLRQIIPSDLLQKRITRIFDMSPKLQFLHLKKYQSLNIPHKNSSKIFVLYLDIDYDPLIGDQYQKLYAKQYQNNQMKNILRQILCELRLDQFNKKIKKGNIINKRKVNILEYELQDIKMMKKQKKSQNNQFQKCNSFDQNNTLVPLLQKISKQCSKSLDIPVQYNNLSIQIVKKIKFLLYLFQKKNQHLNQNIVVEQMLQQVKQRGQKMPKIYQHAKFGLLAVIGNIRHYKNLLLCKKDIERKVNTRVRYIKMLQILRFSLCLTSPYTRNNPQFGTQPLSPGHQRSNTTCSQQNDESPSQFNRKTFMKQKSQKNKKQQQMQNNVSDQQQYNQQFNRYRYRISNFNDIILCETNQCIHKQNIFWGLNYHISNINQFVDLFCKIKQLNQTMYFAQFIIKDNIAQCIYKKQSDNLQHNYKLSHPLAHLFLNPKYQRLSFSYQKINKAVYLFIQIITNMLKSQYQQLNTFNNLQSHQFKKIIKNLIFRQIHFKLIKKKQNAIFQNDYQMKQLKRKNKFKDYLFQNFIIINQKKRKFIDNLQLSHVQNQTQSNTNFPQQNNFETQTFVFNNDQNLQKKQQNQLYPNKYNPQSNIKSNRIYFSRNDQILLYQINKINKSLDIVINKTNNSDRYQISQQKQNNQISPNKPQSMNIPLLNKNTGLNQMTQNQYLIYIKQIQQMSAKSLKQINKKQTPQDKLQCLKNVIDIYKLMIYNNKNIINQTYTQESLICKSILLAQPVNFISNLAFIQIFIPQQKLLSIQGKIINQFKKVTQNIFSCQNLDQYLSATNLKDNYQQKILNAQMIEMVENIKRKDKKLLSNHIF